jgi:hypothetical protein
MKQQRRTLDAASVRADGGESGEAAESAGGAHLGAWVWRSLDSFGSGFLPSRRQASRRLNANSP